MVGALGAVIQATHLVRAALVFFNRMALVDALKASFNAAEESSLSLLVLV
ncbi:MAG: hypothetical protein IPN98_10485 [Propionivibrio sp.]|nr:hypothetical protein [Propionivibrio sp.]